MLYIDFRECDGVTSDDIIDDLKTNIKAIYLKHKFLLKSGKLDIEEINDYSKLLNSDQFTT